MSCGSDFEKMIGRTVKAVYALKGGTSIGFNTDKGYIEYRCEGDCCSYSWFENITGIDFLIGQKVLESKDLEIPEPTQTEDHECLKNYGYRLTTAKGYFEIEMRNSSNGYYGGYITDSDEYEYESGRPSSPILTGDF